MLLDGKVCVCVCVQGLCNQTALVYVLTLPLNELYDLGQVSYCCVWYPYLQNGDNDILFRGVIGEDMK